MDNRDYPSFGGNAERCRPAAIPPPAPQGQAATDGDAAEADPFPGWFTALLQEATRKPSAHTMKAYRQDFLAIANLATGGDPARMDVVDITKELMRAAFASYAHDHEAASIRALLVGLECVVHLPLHRRTTRRQPDAAGRPTQTGQRSAQGPPPRRGRGAVGDRRPRP
jgi:hypothetical protein